MYYVEYEILVTDRAKKLSIGSIKIKFLETSEQINIAKYQILNDFYDSNPALSLPDRQQCYVKFTLIHKLNGEG
jgi:hypothetical protein